MNDYELVGAIPKNVFKKILRANKQAELFQAIKDQNPDFMFNVIEFCVTQKIKLTGTDFNECRKVPEIVNKRLEYVPRHLIKSVFNSSLYQKAWDQLHGIRKFYSKPPPLIDRNDYQ